MVENINGGLLCCPDVNTVMNLPIRFLSKATISRMRNNPSSIKTPFYWQADSESKEICGVLLYALPNWSEENPDDINALNLPWDIEAFIWYARYKKADWIMFERKTILLPNEEAGKAISIMSEALEHEPGRIPESSEDAKSGSIMCGSSSAIFAVSGAMGHKPEQTLEPSEDAKMLCKPAAGWTSLVIGNTKISSLSYIDDIPEMLLDAFIERLSGSANGLCLSFDSEGYTQALTEIDGKLYHIIHRDVPEIHMIDVPDETDGLPMMGKRLIEYVGRQIAFDILYNILDWVKWDTSEELDGKDAVMNRFRRLAEKGERLICLTLS